MKVLHTVESYEPSLHGMQQVVKQISERLVRLGHDVTIATSFHHNRLKASINGVKIEEFKISGKSVDGYIGDDLEIKRYRDYLLNSDYDIITNFAAQQWATDLALPILDKIRAVKIFVPTGFSELSNLKFKEYFDSMKLWMREYDMNIFLSNDYQDINFAIENGVKNIKVIPNGASEEEFAGHISLDIREQLRIPKNHFVILNVGSHTGLKGHNEAIKIFNKAKIKKATLLIIGNSIQQENTIYYFLKYLFKSIEKYLMFFSKKRIVVSCLIKCKLNSILNNFTYDRIFNKKILIVKNLTRIQTVEAYKDADIFLFTSNIECSPVVLFECMASKTPFLTTDVGNAKEIISWSKSGILLPTIYYKNNYVNADINKSARLVEQLFHNPNMRTELKINGYEAWIKKFTWETISIEYENVYKSLIS